MGYIVRSVNFFLIFLLLLSLLSLLGGSVFFQSRFDALSGDYIMTLERMKETSASLDTYKKLYLEAITNLNETSQDVKQYDVLFTTKSQENEQLNKELTTIEKEFKSTKSLLLSTTDELASTRYALDEKSELADKYYVDLRKLRDDFVDMSRDFNSTKATLADKIADYNELQDDFEDYQAAHP